MRAPHLRGPTRDIMDGPTPDARMARPRRDRRLTEFRSQRTDDVPQTGLPQAGLPMAGFQAVRARPLPPPDVA